MAVILGTTGADSLVGGDGDDLIRGLGGPDVLQGGVGSDTLEGGAAPDTIFGGLGTDVIVVDGEDLVILRPVDSAPIFGQIDTIIGWTRYAQIAMGDNSPAPGRWIEASADTFDAALALANGHLTAGQYYYVAVAVGSDVYVFANSTGPDNSAARTAVRLADTRLQEVSPANFTSFPLVPANAVVRGTEQAENLQGGSPGNDTIMGLGGNDVLGRSPGFDLILGGDGNDQIEEITAGDTLIGGNGDDFIIVRPFPFEPSGLLQAGAALVSTVDGGPGDDNLSVEISGFFEDEFGVGHRLDAVVTGGEGNDAIFVRGEVGGSIDGGPGDDRIAIEVPGLSVRVFTPVLTLGPGADSFSFGVGSESGWATLVVTDFNPVEDRYGLGFTGFSSDTIRLAFQRLVQDGADTVLQVDIDGPEGPLPYSDVIRFLNVRATDFQSGSVVTLPASARQPTAGPDNLSAIGARELHAGAGNDTITSSSTATYLRGDEGDDSILGGTGFDDINGNMGADTLTGGLGDDWVVGGKDNDRIDGGYGADLVYGNLGDDTVDGGNGSDTVRGGQGADVLQGGLGDDYLSGDRGDDTVSGGFGHDTFHGSQDAGIDRVLDFNALDDVVRLDPGTTYTLRQVGPDTVVDMGGGNQMILVNRVLADLPAGWIFVG
jgi:Ca2+-binding RTX toxin-like protein